MYSINMVMEYRVHNIEYRAHNVQMDRKPTVDDIYMPADICIKGVSNHWNRMRNNFLSMSLT